MSLYVILGERPGGFCRVCRKTVQGTEAQVARHMQACGRAHAEQTHAQRHAFDSVLLPADPEWARYVQNGRHKPSTTRIK